MTGGVSGVEQGVTGDSDGTSRDVRAGGIDALLAWTDAPSHRVLTISGPGGIGATHVARRLLDRMGATRTVDMLVLDDVEDPAEVLSRIEDLLDRGDLDAMLLDGLTRAAVRVGTAPVLERVLSAHPELLLIVTSRVPLHLRVERVVVLAPLAVPERAAEPPAIRTAPAVALFCEVAVATGATVTDADLPLIADICRRLDGLPLAISLAARRAGQMSISELARQLDVRAGLDVLRDGPVDAPPRHRDLAESVRWSLALLSDRQHRILVALSVLHDPATLDELVALTLETVPGTRAELLEALDALVRHHLLSSGAADELRLRAVPPVVRAVVAEQTPAEVRRAAIEAVDRSLLPFATQHVAGARAHGQATWAAGLSRRHRDLVAAFERALDRGDVHAASVLAAATSRVWHDGGQGAVALPLLRGLLDALAAHDDEAMNRAMIGGWVTLFEVLTSADQTRRRELGLRFDALVDAAAETGDAIVLFDVVERSVAAVRYSHHFDRLISQLERTLCACDEAGLSRHAAACAVWLAMTVNVQQRFDDAARLAFAAMSRARAIGNDAQMAYAAMVLAHLPPGVVAAHGPPVTMEQAVVLARRSGDQRLLANILPGVAAVRAALGDRQQATLAVAEGFELALATGLHDGALGSLLVIVEIAAAREDDEVAAVLTGGLADQWTLIEGPLSGILRRRHDAMVDGVRSRLGDTRFRQALATGAAMSWDELADHALATVRGWTRVGGVPAPPAGKLTAREREVLRALVAGASNKELAVALGITRKTAMHHTSNIYRKLGVRGRAEAVSWAYRNGVLETP